MQDQAAIEMTGSSFVLLVKNLEQTEVIGSKVQHHHISRDKLTLILVEAREEEEVRPISSRYEEQYFRLLRK